MSTDRAAETLTPAHIRAAIAWRHIRLYHLAPVVGLHPSRLSVLLSGRVEIPPDIAAKILRAVEEWPKA